MAYIGRDTDKISNVEVLDNITFDGSSSYTLQKNSVNFTPSSANTLLVSIDGVVQAGNFTVSGSTIDFGTAVAGTSTCDFILHYGTGLITTPADGTVTTAKLGSNAVTSAKMFSGFANGITEADQWRLTADITTNADITSNLERVDSTGFGYLGTGMTESSGIFTFPSTGIWLIKFFYNAETAASDNVLIQAKVTTDNTNYNVLCRSGVSGAGGLTNTGFAEGLFDVTNTSTHKVKFTTVSIGAGSYIDGDTSENFTAFSFTRLGDT